MNVYGFQSFHDEVAQAINRANVENVNYYQRPFQFTDIEIVVTDNDYQRMKNNPYLFVRIKSTDHGNFRKGEIVKYTRRIWEKYFSITPRIFLPLGEVTLIEIIRAWIKQTGQNDLTKEGFLEEKLFDVDFNKKYQINYDQTEEIEIKFHPLNPEWFGVGKIIIMPFDIRPTLDNSLPNQKLIGFDYPLGVSNDSSN